ncbi:gamma-secretase subunit Aph-1b isoform X2 [Phyllopteryx taeniolatus]|uniref:gamma-secretase subunit Aph-1b isoform X2 n=1 Tax=Phyllopteryx taeniolatus TaxID=161469 RepID=UPI002AD23153|nr:gamma-secretase subunit Aph-1b isoform X2 [Phyllopteryx taeniolatus]
MTVAVFFGCTFIAFGPAIALFLFTIAREPLRVIFLIAGAFFWLVSLLLSSLVWFISVQETFRFAYYKLLKKANEGLLTLSQEETMPISIRQLAYVSGLGFGFMSGAFSVVNILADSVGPGTIGIHGDSQHYFLSSAFMTMAIILLHMFWGVVFFDACEKQQWWAVATVVISHLVVSCLTFQNPEYVASLVPTYMILFLMGVWAFYSAGGSLRSLKLCLTCKDKDFLLASHRSR